MCCPKKREDRPDASAAGGGGPGGGAGGGSGAGGTSGGGGSGTCPAGGTTAPCAATAALVRLVDDGGNPSTASAAVKTIVEVSNRVTTQDLPAGFNDASTDRDNFKVEVFDMAETGATIPAGRVLIEMFKPGPPPAAFSPRRTLNVELQKVPGRDHFYRSRYLRLVVDDADQAAKPTQTVLADWDPSDPNVEILGQILRVTYTSSTGNVVSEVTVGGPTRSYIRTAIHILRTTPGGAPVVTTADARKRMQKWFRRVFAQISMTPQVLQVREIDPLENLVSISNDTGANATGGAGSRIAFRIRAVRAGAPDKVLDVGPYTPPAGATPIATAQALESQIRTAGTFTVRTVQNPPTLEPAITQGSADIILTDPDGGRVRIENLVQTDASQTVSVGRVNTASFGSWALGTPARLNWVVGSIQQRTVLQAYDTGSDRIDIVVVGTLDSPNRGQAMMPGSIYAAGRQALPAITRSAFVNGNTMDGTDNDCYNTAHECGHTLLDAIHAQDNTQLMMGQGTSMTNIVSGSKRFSDQAVAFDNPAQNIVQETRIRTQGAPVLGPFP
jgi:hypothetical protein